MKNILVTIDFDDESNVILNKAIEIAQKFNSKIWLIHVAAPNPDFVGYEVGPQYIRDFRASELRREHELIHEYTVKLKEKNIESEGLVIQGATVDMVIEESQKLNIDLLVIGHHKHNFLYKVFIENTEDQIINHSQIPVLVVPLF